jgi:signal transduction histidine kinase
MPFEPRALDLAALARAVAEEWEQDGHEHHLVLDLPAEAVVVDADPARIDQVLANVLDNAAKYSSKDGEIHVQLRREGDGILLSVRDEGIGLPLGSEASIFEPFGRARNAVSRQIPGMGLGLHISRSIVERHGGRMWAESAGEARGTTMHVWLPVRRATEASGS